jgi:hypothetical protein
LERMALIVGQVYGHKSITVSASALRLSKEAPFVRR